VHKVDGVRVTGIIRTLIDITRFHGLADGVVSMDSALARYPELTKDLMLRALAKLPRIKRRKTVLRAIELASAKSESPLESFARVDLHEWNHPLIHSIEAQVQFRLSDGHIVRVDLVINHWLIIELDGQVKYDGKTYGKPADEVLRAERLREKELQAQGRIVLRFQKSDLVHETPGTSVMRTQIDNMLQRFGAQGPQAA
jgi:very-short-patch-repair endonuclease